MPTKEQIVSIYGTNHFMTIELTKRGEVVLVYTNYYSPVISKVTLSQKQLKAIIRKFHVDYILGQTIKVGRYDVEYRPNRTLNATYKIVTIHNRYNSVSLNVNDVIAIENWLNS